MIRLLGLKRGSDLVVDTWLVARFEISDVVGRLVLIMSRGLRLRLRLAVEWLIRRRSVCLLLHWLRVHHLWSPSVEAIVIVVGSHSVACL